MRSPSTYAEWIILLEKFAQGNNSVIEEMNSGFFVVDAGTASRFYSKVEEAYKKRKQNWLDVFQKSLGLIKNDDDFEIILHNGKKNLTPLSRFIAIAGLPQDLRAMLQKDLEHLIAEIKKSLKSNISRSSNSREKILMLLNSFNLSNNFVEEVTIIQKTKQKGNNEGISITGRKIIFKNGK